MADHSTAISGHPVPTRIDDVLEVLDHIIDLSIRENSTTGIFAYVYRRTTAKVKAGIADGRFEDNGRMESFDVAFARKYIDAWWNHRQNKPVARAWKLAFSSTDSNLIIIQHIILGMNAHINLDLGIAASEFAPGDQIYGLERDFMEINKLLEELVDEVQERISRVSPLMFLLDWFGKSDDEAMINFSITKARDSAWNVAKTLAGASNDQKADIIKKTDFGITKLGEIVARPPGFIIPRLLRVIRLFEEKNIRQVIEKLRI